MRKNRILLLKRGEIAYNSLNIFADLLGKAFEQIGIPVDFYSIFDSDESFMTYMNSHEYSAAIAFNSLGQQNYKIGEENLWDHYGIPFFNYIVDHPQMHGRALHSDCKNYNVLCMDEDHVQYINQYFPDVKSAYFQPLGGLENELNNRENVEYKDREHDVLFMASSGNISLIEKKIINMPKTVKSITVDYIEYLLEHREVNLEDGLKKVLGAYNIEFENSKVFSEFAAVCMPAANNYVRAYIREEAVRYLALSDAEISIFGEGWDNIRKECQNIHIFESVPYDRTSEIFRNAKLIFNVMPLFKNGSHDRIATGMLNKTVVFTDKSGYLERILPDDSEDKKILYWNNDHPEKIPEIVNGALSDIDILNEINKRAYSYASENMTWKKVAENINEIILSYCSE